MKRSLVFAVAALVASLFVGTALKVQAATTATPAAAVAQVDDDSSTGYWVAVAQAAAQ